MPYADPNYDPVKAHEYYMEHRQLKGNRSTKGFSETQKAQIAFAKAQLSDQKTDQLAEINEWKKAQIQAISERVKNQNMDIREARARAVEAMREAAKAKKETLTRMGKLKIEALRRHLQEMPPERKKQMRDKIESLIGTLSNKMADAKFKITENTQKKVKKTQEKAKAETEKNTAKGKADKENVRAQAKAKKEEVKAGYESAVDKAYSDVRGE